MKKSVKDDLSELEDLRSRFTFEYLDAYLINADPNADTFDQAATTLDGEQVSDKYEMASEILKTLGDLFIHDPQMFLLIMIRIAKPELTIREAEKYIGLKRTMISKRSRELAEIADPIGRVLHTQTPRALSQQRRRKRENK